jgi:hypothetical protein
MQTNQQTDPITAIAQARSSQAALPVKNPCPCAQRHRIYNLKVSTLVVSAEVAVDPNCNGFVVINNGDTPCTINGVPLNPSPAKGYSGESYGMAGNVDEIYRGRIDIVFAPLVTSQFVTVIQKYFID